MSTQQSLYAKVVAQAWPDEDYKRRLVEDPRAVLSEAGVEVPEGHDVRVVENTETASHFVLPAAPAEGEISEEQLADVTGGTLCGMSLSGPYFTPGNPD